MLLKQVVNLLLVRFLAPVIIVFSHALPVRQRFTLLARLRSTHNSSFWLDTLQEYTQLEKTAEAELKNISSRLELFDSRSSVNILPQSTDFKGRGKTSFPGEKIPVVSYCSLSYELLADAMSNHGTLIIKGGLKPSDVSALKAGVVSARAARESGCEGGGGRMHYSALQSGQNQGRSHMIKRSVYLPEAPAVLTDFLSVLYDGKFKSLIRKYLLGAASFSVEKSVLRVAEPDDSDKWDFAWHQDGAFLGENIRSLNMWVALTDCGVDAPSLDIVTNRYNEVLPTGTDRAFDSWALGPELVASEIEKNGYEHLIVEAGDVVLFDHLNVHRTGMLKGMTQDRYAIECWFFSEFGFPEGKTGMRF